MFEKVCFWKCHFLFEPLGNYETCELFRNISMRTSTNFFLFSLAVADIAILLMGQTPSSLYFFSSPKSHQDEDNLPLCSGNWWNHWEFLVQREAMMLKRRLWFLGWSHNLLLVVTNGPCRRRSTFFPLQKKLIHLRPAYTFISDLQITRKFGFLTLVGRFGPFLCIFKTSIFVGRWSPQLSAKLTKSYLINLA